MQNRGNFWVRLNVTSTHEKANRAHGPKRVEKTRNKYFVIESCREESKNLLRSYVTPLLLKNSSEMETGKSLLFSKDCCLNKTNYGPLSILPSLSEVFKT
ncbi:unnamed protein product [Pocillopora meandrina]|uniref:Uncharacterized protein n=1 Tax=Pocillopora meandrina TaxID=46732 RepID=A0AAU9WH54_9CNID|nr:unnamed protein product [Pocillopora meandrina]